MKKSKQKSRKFKRYIRKQLKKAKEDVVKLPMSLADMPPHPYLNGFCHHPGGLSHEYRHNPHYDNYVGHHNHVRHHYDAGIHLHSPHEIPRHNHCHGSDSIKVFDKEDSEVRVEEKM